MTRRFRLGLCLLDDGIGHDDRGFLASLLDQGPDLIGRLSFSSFAVLVGQRALRPRSGPRSESSKVVLEVRFSLVQRLHQAASRQTVRGPASGSSEDHDRPDRQGRLNFHYVGVATLIGLLMVKSSSSAATPVLWPVVQPEAVWVSSFRVIRSEGFGSFPEPLTSIKATSPRVGIDRQSIDGWPRGSVEGSVVIRAPPVGAEGPGFVW